MKRAARRLTVDFYHSADVMPEVGNVVRDVAHDGRVRGYVRVLAVRQVKVRVSRGELARYALQVERLGDKPPEGVTFTVTAYPPKPKVDRWSPLL